MFDERMISMFESLKIPNTYWKNKSYEYQYWFRSLLQKIDSSLVFKNLPENWPQDYFLMCLWAFGYLAVFQSNRKFADPKTKTAFAVATVSQWDFYYQPVKALVSNPMFCKEFTIHEDCEILKLTPDCYWRGGCLDIIAWYAQRLAELTKAIDVGIQNAKTPMMGFAKDPATAQRLKALYDRIQSGEGLTLLLPDEVDSVDEMIPNKEPLFTWQNDLKNNYIVTELLQNMQCILNQFYMEIGLPTILDDKKAHTLNAEADFQSAQSQARIACWVQTLNESFEYINDHFGLELEVEYAQRNEDESLGSGRVPESDE